MNKIFLLLWGVVFFLDFSFIPSLLSDNLSWPYFVISLITAIFLIEKNINKNIFWGILAVFILNILLPFSLFGYGVIMIIIWSIIYFLKNVFFNEEHGYLASNFTFITIFLLFAGLFFLGQYILSKISGKIYLGHQNINWILGGVKLFVGILIFNPIYKLIYKLCGKNTPVLK